MANCRPGQKAIAIKSRNPKNLFKLVMVVEEYKDGVVIPGMEGATLMPLPPGVGLCWVIETLGTPFDFSHAPRKTLHDPRFNVTPDSWLRPLLDLDGNTGETEGMRPPLPIETKTKEKTNG